MDLQSIITPVDVEVLRRYLRDSRYDMNESNFLLNGFSNGFSLCYEGPQVRADKSENLPFSIGDKYQLWNKVMKEVKVGRYAGPFSEVPFKNFIQSPIGLVPKAGNQT